MILNSCIFSYFFGRLVLSLIAICLNNSCINKRWHSFICKTLVYFSRRTHASLVGFCNMLKVSLSRIEEIHLNFSPSPIQHAYLSILFSFTKIQEVIMLKRVVPMSYLIFYQSEHLWLKVHPWLTCYHLVMKAKVQQIY